MESLLIYLGVLILGLVIFVPYVLKFRRDQRVNYARRKEAEELGVLRPQSQYPMIDHALCIGCGSCVKACPEGDVLGVVHGKAMIINGVRCVGHGRCEPACPVGAVKVGLGDITRRDDIPVLTEGHECNVPGLYIVGELGGLSLIRNAVQQGSKAVKDIAGKPRPAPSLNVHDVLIVGAGPAGLSAALSCIEHELNYVVLDQQEPGGTILQYPRRKLVMTQPVEIPLYGKLTRSEYTKEQLLEIWEGLIRDHQIRIRSGEKVASVIRGDGHFVVESSERQYLAHNVILALGRRGIPRKLGVSGEDMSKVAYQLLDAQSYDHQNVLVVGGGDSAIEVATALSRQKGNVVTISYRKPKFFRIKKKNEERIHRLMKEKKVTAIFDSNVLEIQDRQVRLQQGDTVIELPNDYVFVFAGGIPPFKMLREMGIRFGGDAVTLAQLSA